MLRVALTGNIASGKSEVANQFRRRGAVVIDADELAREVVRPGTPALAEIAARWGAGVLQADGSLDRTALRRIVFASPGEREALNAIIHPRVEALRAVRLQAAAREQVPLVVSDVPLLFEVGLEGRFDRVVLVHAPESLRHARLVRLRGLSDDEARQMIAAQLPSEAKRPRAHFVIENDGTLDDLRSRADAVWNALCDAAQAARAQAEPTGA